ncbi:Putative protein of unknown function [Podospora comata]|uniref:Peptidase C14 caspase domain-containing protein n=1 Tax=Podospora comata TaxID=48703 RepID=A0ABY6RZG9_PODCO|nr:Putative protein of unknown function [Podospora comata]
MTATKDTIQTHHAILIGVGSHNKESNEKPVKGAFADMEAISAIFDQRPHVKVTKFAIGAEGEKAGQAPTTCNIRSFLEDITAQGSESQTTHMYIHFSGHGTRQKGNNPVILVLYDGFLRTSKLAQYLNKLNKKGIHVTLVLDCCFSASVCRDHDDSFVRFMEYDPQFDLDPEDATAPNEDLFIDALWDDCRGATLQVDRFLDSKAYTMFTACDSNEVAEEIITENRTRRGALSYFLFRALEEIKVGTHITHRSLHHHLRSQFRKALPRQTPMLYGRSQDAQSFFSQLTSGFALQLVSLYQKDGVIILEAGEAQGVHVGDEYEAFPFHAAESVKGVTAEHSVRLKVENVYGSTSRLCHIDQSQICSRLAKGTWKARLVISFSENKTPVRLLPSLPRADRQAIRQEVGRHTFLQLHEADDETFPHAFSVAMDTESSGYEIYDAMGKKVPSIPTIERGDSDALQKLAKVLGHLAKFSFYQKLENQQPDGQFQTSFTVQTDHQPGQDGWYEVENYEEWACTCTNNGNSPLYVSILSFGSCLGIYDLVSEEGSDGEFWTLQAAQYTQESSRTLRLKMNVSDGEGDQREDVIKLFITNKQTSFQAMSLPPIAEVLSSKGDDEDKPSKPSGIVFGDDEKWAVQTFRIKTTIRC